jgi:hypothetical protein
MRISAQSALFDQNEETASIDGVEQSRWLASYNAWGDWLNTQYTPPDGGSLDISDTYDARREAMFRRWLVSLPPGAERDGRAPDVLSGWDESRTAVLVGRGTLGEAADEHPDQVTRAYLQSIGDRGRAAWWIGPENHKARVDLGGPRRSPSAGEWEDSHGDTAEVGVGGLPDLGILESNPLLRERMITADSMRHAGVAEEAVRERFFDLTAHSRGVIASVRTGRLKKDLSLLFEKDASQLPARYAFNQGRDIREPSIRPMSPDLADKQPQIPNRHFQSWTNMRHFYRMYRRESDATVGEVGGKGSLNWLRSKPFTDYVSSNSLGNPSAWDGSNNYWRVPILAKITFIYSLVSEPSAEERGKYDCYHVYSPVFTYWNPYNTEMRIPDGTLEALTSAYKILPNSGEFWLGATLKFSSDDLGAFGQMGYSQGVNTRSKVRSGGGDEIVFAPGELKVFSHASRIETGAEAGDAELVPGFNPQAIGGEKKLYGTYSPDENPGLAVEFSHSYWGGNINWGNTGGSLCMQFWWDRSRHPGGIPITYANDWFQKDQTHTPMTPRGLSNVARWVFADSEPVPIAFCQLVIKGLSEFNYESIRWDRDWRSRNWIQAPPFYFGSGMYISENDSIAHTQRLDNPYVMFFGPTSMSEMPKVVGHVGSKSFMGSGSNPFEKVTSVPALELPTAPAGSLAAFAGMRINPGWLDPGEMGPHLKVGTYGGDGFRSTGEESLHAADTKRVAYQSGGTGPGIGNSFIHPMIPRDDVYRYFDNSKSEDVPDRSGQNWRNTKTNDTKAYNDFWDHALLLNDALWDDYFVSSLADQLRPGNAAAVSLSENLQRLVDGEMLSNSRNVFYSGGRATDEIKEDLEGADGYLKAAAHLMIDGMFNVNSTSVDAWHALFAGIRERQVVYRDQSGGVRPVTVPSDKRIALSRFNTATTDQEMIDPEYGVNLDDGGQGWSGVRFLDDDQLRRLAEECVKQVKLRGPFLNLSEFINRRLSNDELGLMGALQSAIDYDDDSPDPDSLNYPFKNGPDFMIEQSDLGRNMFATPEGAEGSRFAGIPGYILQSDLLKPIANTLAVRDDTFRIRAYGETVDKAGEVVARAWCEAIVQRFPEYQDPANDADVPARRLDESGRFEESRDLTPANVKFGRRFEIVGFRWLGADEV